MTFAEILSDLYRRTNQPTSPASDTVTRYKAFCNETHRTILSMPAFSGLRDDQTTVTSVANQPLSALPESVARITQITDHTNEIKLREISLNEIRERDPGLTTSGNPWGYARYGTRQVATQPSSTGVWAVSTSAGDTTQTVTVTAIRSGGYVHQPSAATLTGTTRVQVGSQTDYVEVTKFYLSAACAGDVTLYDAAASGNVLAVIPKGQTFARYLTIHWYPVPASAITFTVDYSRVIPDLVNNTDEPLLPVDFHDLIGIGARMKEYEKTKDSRYGVAKQEYDDRLRALRAWVQNDGAYLLALRRRPMRWSMLGGQYPADVIGGGW